MSAQEVLDVAQGWIMAIDFAESPNALEALEEARTAHRERRKGTTSQKLFSQLGI